MLLDLKLGSGISSYACGSAHSVIFTNSSDIFVTGWNGFGQLGFGDDADRSNFEKIPRSFTPKLFAVGNILF
jgi:alpha-tubulin suppressor-like RCC1 family protein